jgi:NADPH-dependent 2,4-dienoyl-CoA reductase/sulfur reductase-like enzyme/nitrite reductase/ring-hydroxylating ferredoxin subunit
MGEHKTELSGPDLAAGIAAADLADGAMLLGHAGGEAVLIARRGDEVFAVGATCTHYSGPLAEGLMVDDTVRCPWHHACFSLRTGEAVRAPALRPVACWKVEREGGRILVREKLKRGASDRRPKTAPESVVIIGGGGAGDAAADMLRREGYEGPVTLLSADDGAPYDRPNLSKDYLAGTAPEDWLPLRSGKFYTDRKIELRLGTTATAIDVGARRVTLADGGALTFGALLLATGAAPVRLPVPGADLPHVLYLRSLADSRAIAERAKAAKRAVVIGASFIGLEVAASLRTLGLEVHVVAPEERPMERLMGPDLAAFITGLHREKGVVFHLEEKVAAIEAGRVKLGGGDAVDADLVVIGIGVRPSVELAEQAGLAVDNGVLVDQYLQTSAPGIFAAGDIARWPDPHSGMRLRIEHWVVAQRQGQTAARNMLGAAEAFDAVPFFWSQHYDASISYVGHAEKWERAKLDGDPAKRDCTVRFTGDGRTLAVATIFRDRESLEAERQMERDSVTA